MAWSLVLGLAAPQGLGVCPVAVVGCSWHAAEPRKPGAGGQPPEVCQVGGHRRGSLQLEGGADYGRRQALGQPGEALAAAPRACSWHLGALRPRAHLPNWW